MPNPFDDEDGMFRVLVNAEDQHCLWPIFRDIPEGWVVVYGAGDGAARSECLEYVERHWTDMRPKSIR